MGLGLSERGRHNPTFPRKRESPNWTFSKKCSGTRPLLLDECPERATGSSPGQARGRRPSAPPWGSVPINSSPLPRIARLWAIRGRGWERGHLPAESESPASFPQECLVGTKREVCETVEPSPLTLALSPNPRNGDGGPKSGERENIVGTMTQGGSLGLLPRACPGLQSTAPLGPYVEEAASCRFTNVQSRTFPRNWESSVVGCVPFLGAHRLEIEAAGASERAKHLTSNDRADSPL
jgi:hypothetical protein